MNKNWTKEQKQAVKHWREFSRALRKVAKKYGNDSEEADAYRETYTYRDWFKLPGDEIRRINKNAKLPKPAATKNPAEKIVENLIKLTTVPIEKSVIKWRVDKVFGQYYFETEHKDKIYTFDGRHFYVYPAGYELPPGVSIGGKSGPELLCHVRIDAIPKQLGKLWRQLCGQHERKLKKDCLQQDKERDLTGLRYATERLMALEKTRQILNGFK